MMAKLGKSTIKTLGNIIDQLIELDLTDEQIAEIQGVMKKAEEGCMQELEKTKLTNKDLQKDYTIL